MILLYGYSLIVTVGAVAVYVLMRREVKRGAETIRSYQKALNKWIGWHDDQMFNASRWASRAIDAEDRLRQIKAAASARGRNARAIQLARQNALRDARTAELQRGIAAKTDRVAA